MNIDHYDLYIIYDSQTELHNETVNIFNAAPMFHPQTVLGQYFVTSFETVTTLYSLQKFLQQLSCSFTITIYCCYERKDFF